MCRCISSILYWRLRRTQYMMCLMRISCSLMTNRCSLKQRIESTSTRLLKDKSPSSLRLIIQILKGSSWSLCRQILLQILQLGVVAMRKHKIVMVMEYELSQRHIQNSQSKRVRESHNQSKKKEEMRASSTKRVRRL